MTTTSPILAYHSSQAVKYLYLDRFRDHRAKGHVVGGLPFNPKSEEGCFIKCTIGKYSHNLFSSELGFPVWMTILAEGLFENCSTDEEGGKFGEDLLESVQPGMDLERVRFAVAVGCYQRILVRLEKSTDIEGEKTKDAILKTLAWVQLGAPENERLVVLDVLNSVMNSGKRSISWFAHWSAAYSAYQLVEYRDVEASDWRAACEAADAAFAWGKSTDLLVKAAEFKAQREDLLAAIRALPVS